jgi:phosphoglycolate phosphatase-like HAD superfamily hydrolase
VFGGLLVRAVIFDLDGTLVNPEECYVIGDAVRDLLAARRASMLGVVGLRSA